MFIAHKCPCKCLPSPIQKTKDIIFSAQSYKAERDPDEQLASTAQHKHSNLQLQL
jgi:hypothetical protein